MSSSERHRQAIELFQQALDVAPDRRAAWLAEQTASDADLRSDVESLLRAHEMTGGILDQAPRFGGPGASGAGDLPFSIEEIEAAMSGTCANGWASGAPLLDPTASSSCRT